MGAERATVAFTFLKRFPDAPFSSDYHSNVLRQGDLRGTA